MQRASRSVPRRAARRRPARRPQVDRARARPVARRSNLRAPAAGGANRPAPQSRQRPTHSLSRNILGIGILGALAMVFLCLVTVAGGAAILYGGGKILPGVSVAGTALGGMNETEAAQALVSAWGSGSIVLRDGTRTWSAAPGDLGITLDAQASVEAARAWGRSEGGLAAVFRALSGRVALAPAVSVDWSHLTEYLQEARGTIEIPARNAGVQLVNGQAQERPAEPGRALDVPATLDALRAAPGEALADGTFDLVMRATAPEIADASALVAQANALLASPFIVHGYDPIRDEWASWSAPPEVWAEWIAAANDTDSPTGLALSLDPAGPDSFLNGAAQFDDERYIKVDEAVALMQEAVAAGQAEATTRIWHNETTYTVSAGQTLAQIGEEVGIPYPFIQAANPGINANALSAGQVLTLPSRDVLVPLEVVPHKRIVVSRSQQDLWAYENGEVVFDWVISTGIASSPTAPGVFQVQSHELNAYADQWNLYMPHFIGFYHPGPNVEVMNGFHGFPTSASGGYLLWTDDLGRPATYGCVLLSLENASTLYGWAEEGVVVEVTP